MSTALATLAAAVRAAFPGIDAPQSAVMRLIRAVGPRVSLQQIALQDQAPEASPVEVWPGVPGVTSDPSPGEEVVILFVGKDQVPYVIGRGREGGPGDVPQAVRHDAVTAIRFLSRAASLGAKVRVGADLPTPPVPVALAGPLSTYLAALETWALSVDLAIAPAVLLLTAPQQAAYAAAVTTRTTAAGNFSAIPSTNLEAK
jgi:hypothetical protein